jgi:hypothetical protein
MDKRESIWYYLTRDRFDASPGMAWEQDIFQGTIIEQRFSFEKHKRNAQSYPCSAGLILDKRVYASAVSPKTIRDEEILPPYETITPEEPFALSKIVVLKMEWINQWFRQDVWDNIGEQETTPSTVLDNRVFKKFIDTKERTRKSYILYPIAR